MTIPLIKILEELEVTEFSLKGHPTNEEEFNQMFQKAIGVDQNDTAIMSSNPDDFGVTWAQIETKLSEYPMKLLREERNKKLIETDWTQSRDVLLSNDADWKTYRQELRDLPAISEPKLDEQGNIINVTWPTKPE